MRNVAIVAHVDHGKTTLVDELLKVASASAASTADTSNSISDGGSNSEEDPIDLNRLMDSGELEIERGITITSKVTRLDYYSNKDGIDEHMIINVVGKFRTEYNTCKSQNEIIERIFHVIFARALLVLLLLLLFILVM